MDAIVFLRHLPLLNTLILSAMFIYLLAKSRLNTQILLFSFSLLPPLLLQFGTHLFIQGTQSALAANLIVLSLLFVPITFTPLTRALVQNDQTESKAWLTYYGLQLAVLSVSVVAMFSGNIIEWVTGILDQPVIIIAARFKILFLNTVIACGLTLLRYEVTLKSASHVQVESLKVTFIAFVGFAVYFAYIASQILYTSYISQGELHSGTAVICIGAVLLFYSLLKYPFWEVKVQVTRKAVFGTLSLTAIVLYLVISGTVVAWLRSIQPHDYSILFPAVAFALAALFLLIYLSPSIRQSMERALTNYFFKNRYDYRELWMLFSEKSSGSLDLSESLRRVGEFISDAMFQPQVTIWLRTPNSNTFTLEYNHSSILPSNEPRPTLQWQQAKTAQNGAKIKEVPPVGTEAQDGLLSADNVNVLRKLGVQHIIAVEKGVETVAMLGIGEKGSAKKYSVEEDRLLSSISKQLAHVIVNHRLSDELLLAREWESFNRFSSFVIHDLKNLATLQSMTLENAKSMGNDPRFVADAFETFGQSTDKMINLIASLSVQRGQFSLKKRPVNILDVISSTFGELKIDQRAGLTVKTAFPSPDAAPLISGDPDLLKKVFTNLLLNAIQSLPQGKGAVEISVPNPNNGVVKAGIRDNGCGIAPDQLKNLFRPFQTTKKNGMGIGLCHTRSIVEIHGGHLHIDSRINEGTLVEVEFPRLQA